MRMETVRSDITKFEHSAALSLNDILGTVQDLSDDIRRECGHAIAVSYTHLTLPTILRV